MVRLHNAMRRARKARAQRQQESSFDNANFRYWSIRLGVGEKATVWPAKNKDGDPVVDFVFGHTWKGRRSPVRCTETMDAFHEKCVFCEIHRQENEEGKSFKDRKYSMRTTPYTFVGFWDPNYWTSSKRMGENGKEYTNWSIWVPRREGIERPDGAVLGGERFIRMGPGHHDQFESYVDALEDVCACVALTNDPKKSLVYHLQARCPDCECVIKDSKALDQIATTAEIRASIFKTPQECLPESDGGCWTTEKIEEGDEAKFYPVPDFGCSCFDHQGDEIFCERAEPLDPFYGPAVITRTGEGKKSKYNWARDDSIPWEDWVTFDFREHLPEENKDAFAEGMDFTKKMRVLSLGEQCKLLECPWPDGWAARWKQYGTEFDRKRDDD